MLLGKFKNTTIKIGRQELDTPFADTDDNGMIRYRKSCFIGFDIDRIFYTDANYEGEKDDFSYSLGVQYANQHYKVLH
ncbi:hypothetical protein [Lebetimonas sp. JH292]|uniref:hypothetical protein n=1 Tax=Lebetimonas sp. JH292 TaxID=990068 RepID=UPI000465CF12|nr:hypothetical protein [Lebetimonas sp. JH292]